MTKVGELRHNGNIVATTEDLKFSFVTVALGLETVRIIAILYHQTDYSMLN